MDEEVTHCDFNLADILGVPEIDVALDAVATSVHGWACSVASVEYDIDASACAYVPW